MHACKHYIYDVLPLRNLKRLTYADVCGKRMLTYEVNSRTAAKDSKETYNCLAKRPATACKEALLIRVKRPATACIERYKRTATAFYCL